MGRTLSSVPGFSLFLEGKMARYLIYTNSWAVANRLAEWLRDLEEE